MTPQIKQRIEQIKKNEIPEGYKSTQVGIVPCEWEEKCLSEICSKIGSGKTPLGGESVYKESGIPFIRSQNVLSGSFTFENLAYIDDETNKTMKSSITKKDDILFNITGASIGRCCLIPNELVPSNLNQHVCIIRCKEQNSYYISLLLNNELGQKYVDSFQCGGGRQGLNFQQLGSFSFILPSIDEQNRIAQILSTQDELIEKQEKLIAQKEEQKKYLMQVLLTGKKRLKGFSGEWEERKLGGVCSFQDGYSFLSSDYCENGDSLVQLVRISDINNKNKNIDKVYINQKQIKRDTLDKYLVKSGDLLLSLTGAAGFNFFLWDGELAILNQRTLKINVFENKNKRLLILLEAMLHKYLNKFGTGQNNNLSKEELRNSTILLPSPPEQEAIAEILSTADKEIELLKKQLEEERLKKKSLMQLLLTGIVRV